MGCLIIYRYFKGTTEGVTYSTNRLGTLILCVILVSCFIFLAIAKPHATMLWASVTSVMLLMGFLVAKKRAPELKQLEKGDSEMEMILFLAESKAHDVHLYFRRLKETAKTKEYKDNEVYVSFYSPRLGDLPPKKAPNHFRFPLAKMNLYHRIVAILRVVEYELGDHQIVVHFGWPLSSWLDRISVGVMVYNLMKMPRVFPNFNFDIQYSRGFVRGAARKSTK
jgi:hypothetical protein